MANRFNPKQNDKMIQNDTKCLEKFKKQTNQTNRVSAAMDSNGFKWIQMAQRDESL
jgi:hypothetical protein